MNLIICVFRITDTVVWKRGGTSLNLDKENNESEENTSKIGTLKF